MTWKLYTQDNMEISGRMHGTFNQTTMNLPYGLSIFEDWVRVYRWDGIERI